MLILQIAIGIIVGFFGLLLVLKTINWLKITLEDVKMEAAEKQHENKSNLLFDFLKLICFIVCICIPYVGGPLIVIYFTVRHFKKQQKAKTN